MQTALIHTSRLPLTKLADISVYLLLLLSSKCFHLKHLPSALNAARSSSVPSVLLRSSDYPTALTENLKSPPSNISSGLCMFTCAAAAKLEQENDAAYAGLQQKTSEELGLILRSACTHMFRSSFTFQFICHHCWRLLTVRRLFAYFNAARDVMVQCNFPSSYIPYQD